MMKRVATAVLLTATAMSLSACNKTPPTPYEQCVKTATDEANSYRDIASQWGQFGGSQEDVDNYVLMRCGTENDSRWKQG